MFLNLMWVCAGGRVQVLGLDAVFKNPIPFMGSWGMCKIKFKMLLNNKMLSCCFYGIFVDFSLGRLAPSPGGPVNYRLIWHQMGMRGISRAAAGKRRVYAVLNAMRRADVLKSGAKSRANDFYPSRPHLTRGLAPAWRVMLSRQLISQSRHFIHEQLDLTLIAVGVAQPFI